MNTFGLCFHELLLRLVQHVDVNLVVLLVVDLHDLSRDDWFQSIVVVRQIRKGVLAAENSNLPAKEKHN